MSISLGAYVLIGTRDSSKHRQFMRLIKFLVVSSFMIWILEVGHESSVFCAVFSIAWHMQNAGIVSQ